MPQPVRRRWRTLTAVTLAVLALPATAHAATQTEVDSAVGRGAAWIVDQQDKIGSGDPNPSPNGSLPGFNGNWAITTLAAAGINAADVQKPGVPQSLQDYAYATYGPSWGTLPNGNIAGGFGREALIASSAGIQVTKIQPGINLAASLASRWNATNGNFGAFAPNSDGFALLARDILHLPRGVVEKIDVQLRAAQKTTDGGWTFSASPSGAGDIDMTGAVLSMLCQDGARVGDLAVDRGIAFLNGKLNPTTGGFGTTTVFGIPPSNTPSAAWALIGLKACGVDPQSPAWTTPNGKNPVRFLLDQQRPNGSFRYVPTSADIAPGTDMNSAEAGVRALSSFRWAAPAPPRTNPANPRLRPAPTVADGTTVPIALGVDDRAGHVGYCAVNVASGAKLTDVLASAQTTSIPAGCVSGLQVTDGVVTAVNGAAESATKQWRVRFADGVPSPVADQPVRFGATVSLELNDLALTAAGPAPTFDDQAQASVGAPRGLTFTVVAADGAAPRRAIVSGADADDFLVSGDGCADARLDAGGQCSVRLRFAPTAVGARHARVRLVDADGATVSASVPLVATGTAGGTGGVQGPPGERGPQGADGQPGASGAAGPAGTAGAVGAAGPIGTPGPVGAAGTPGTNGAPGATGPRGANGRDARASCRVVRPRRGQTTVRCTVTTAKAEKAASRTSAQLTRNGRVYARGTLGRLRTVAARRIAKGSYRLRIGRGTARTTVRVVVR